MALPGSYSRTLAEARACTDALFALVRPDSYYERSIPERHRIIFYLGHLEAFDWNQICQGAFGMSSLHPSFDKLFAFGIDPPAGELPQDQVSDWPTVQEVRRYNHRIREVVDEAVEDAPDQILEVALEHRWMHAETFAYILHQLPIDRKKIAPSATPVMSNGSAPAPRMIEIPAGSATLGRSRDGFGWDNEFDAHEAYVPTFAISKYKVTNREYLEFVRAGANPPHFWIEAGDGWRYRTMFEEIPLPLDWPVYVTYREASAYAEWAGKALPTEAQFHRAAYGTSEGEERVYPWGNAAPEATRGNFAFRSWDPIPVSACPGGDSVFGVSQLVGNGWEWTSTIFHAFPGFAPFPFYPGYSARFFDNQHYVLKGGSARTAACLLRRSFRNWFRPNYPYVYAAFRCVEN